jgi:hypothetical protein
MPERKSSITTPQGEVSIPEQVTLAYEEVVEARRSDPDKIFADGHDTLRHLDSSMCI